MITAKRLFETLFITSGLLASLVAPAISVSDLASRADTQKPASLLRDRLPESGLISLPQLEVANLLREDTQKSDNPGPLRFAIPYRQRADYFKEGRWSESNGTSIWRLSVQAKGSQSLNFGFSNVFLPKGAKLFLYTADYKKVIGPFTEIDNKRHRQLWTPVIESEEVILEINIPTHMKPFLNIRLTSINQGYRSILTSKTKAEPSENQSLMGCHNDTICAIADGWRNEIRSVARYTLSGNRMCSGTLVNNVRQDRKPYFLTAEHCGPSVANSPSMVFYWNYENTTCGGSSEGQLNEFTSGATFRANYARPVGSDFALVEIDSIPDNSYNVFWAGWDNSAPAPSSGIVIHHSRGEEKRISFDNDPLTTTASGGNTEDPDGTHLRIGNWDNGLIEGGASGSGIWNASHRIVGNYSGGTASCQVTDGSSWFGRFAISWLGDGSSAGQLKTWLDPDNTGAVTLDGLDNSGSNCSSLMTSMTLSANPTTLNQPVSFNSNTSGGSGSYTYAWDINADGITDSTASSFSFSYPYLFIGNVSLSVDDGAGCRKSTTAAMVVTTDGNEIFLGDGSIPDGWQQAAGSDASWIVDQNERFEGSFSLASATIGNAQSAAIEMSQNFTRTGDNWIGFVIKTDSENNADHLRFYIDNQLTESWSGDTGWQTVHYSLAQGNHTLKWVYEKDASATSGADKVWIDGVTGVNLSSSNQAPVAQVAANIISADEGDSVNMDASNSSDPDGDSLSFQWVQLSGPDVSLSTPTGAITSFTAPSVTAATSLSFRITVSDPSGSSDTEEITVNVANTDNNSAPIAVVTQTSITQNEGTLVTLDASNSSDPDNDNLSFVWTQTSGTNVTLSNAQSQTPTFTAPQVTTDVSLDFSVTVTDPGGASDSASVSVNVTNIITPSPPQESSGGGGSLNFISLLIILLIFYAKRFANRLSRIICQN